MIKSRTVLILGASSDIGLEVVKRFLKSGWNVFAHCNSNEKILKSKYFEKYKFRDARWKNDCLGWL